MTVTFAFHPRQDVRVIAYGLNYPGRVLRCMIQAGDIRIYEVEYAADGEIRRGEFVHDEILDAT